MKRNPYLAPFFRRVVILLTFSIVLVLGFSELAYLLSGEDSSRSPETIEVVIPNGTAARLNAGGTEPAIPEEIEFVIGDVLLVRNEDVVPHQLGPLFIPAGSSASLVMENVEELVYECTFQSSYLGFTVRQPVTWYSRVLALWYAVPATLMFLLVYSFAVKPLKPDLPEAGEELPA